VTGQSAKPDGEHSAVSDITQIERARHRNTAL
jgi:hypothetical protein